MIRLTDLFRNRYEKPLEEELRLSFTGREGLLYDMLFYQLGWTDERGEPLSGSPNERLHSLLSLLSCEAILGEYEPALPAAAAVELVHNHSLVHKDVQSGSPNRGQRSSLWWIWGPGQAINAGDGLHALGRLALMRLKEQGLAMSRVMDSLRLLDQACLSMCEGQHMELAFQEKLDVGVKSYLKMAEAKTGALMSCATALGALVASDDRDLVGAFQEWGRNFGMAYQISKDVEELWGNARREDPSPQVLNKEKLLPIVYAFESGEPRTKRELGTIYFKRVLEPQDVEGVLNILDGVSAREYAKEQVETYCQRATDCLANVELSAWGREEFNKLCRSTAVGG